MQRSHLIQSVQSCQVPSEPASPRAVQTGVRMVWRPVGKSGGALPAGTPPRESSTGLVVPKPLCLFLTSCLGHCSSVCLFVCLCFCLRLSLLPLRGFHLHTSLWYPGFMVLACMFIFLKFLTPDAPILFLPHSIFGHTQFCHVPSWR